MINNTFPMTYWPNDLSQGLLAGDSVKQQMKQEKCQFKAVTLIKAREKRLALVPAGELKLFPPSPVSTPHWCCRAANPPSSLGCESSSGSQKMMVCQCNTSYNSKGVHHVKGKWISWVNGAVPLSPPLFVIYVPLDPTLLLSSLFFFFFSSPAKAYSPEFYYDTPNPTLSQKQSKNYSYVLQWTQKEPNAVDPILKYRLEVRQVRSPLLEPQCMP